MSAQEIRKKFLSFFKEKGHAIIPSASLVPEHDPTVLFTTAGMHPLVPFLLGGKHPLGRRLSGVQKCLRTDDLDEVGDGMHNTFFEMLGNWSLGDYWKKEAITWSFEFLTNKRWIGFDPQKIYVSVFAGDDDAPRDDESIAVWQEIFRKAGIEARVADGTWQVAGSNASHEPMPRIFTYGKDKNWWGPAGMTGPCGPDTEMFFDTRPTFPLENLGGQAQDPQHDPAKHGPRCHPNCPCGRFVEIWNDVFMAYNKKIDGSYEPLKQRNVDTGMGLERMAMILQGKKAIYETDLFTPIMSKIAELRGTGAQNNAEIRAMRIIADHLRASTFLLADGVTPSNLERGYVLRRLIRRAIRYGRELGIEEAFTTKVADVVADTYGSVYHELLRHEERIVEEFGREEERFRATLARGMKEFSKMVNDKALTIDGVLKGEAVFTLYDTYGFPPELTEELAREHKLAIDLEGYKKAFARHQETSRGGTTQKFKGGLADHSQIATRYHTATHLLHQALRDVLGPHVFQKGSNITAERMRFDFSHSKKMTPEELKKAEEVVNQRIKEDLPVHRMEMTVPEAKKLGAIGLFDEKYGEKVSVYKIGDFSKEFCGGPHVKRTGEVGHFKITKEESLGSGLRRIKAIVE